MPATDDDHLKASTPRGQEILAQYRALRKSGNKAARFCTESKFDECCGWCVRIVDEEEGSLQNASDMRK